MNIKEFSETIAAIATLHPDATVVYYNDECDTLIDIDDLSLEGNRQFFRYNKGKQVERPVGLVLILK